ncbi:type II 3-dehydroquinate dehydratase [Crocinitomicaceae bacterium CZZ-1]|uniref:3-dehydroquinate dehydratase n=1 Tax=Taishania pollutisoli TaxID=2766479 RepID=A0A8J6P424_9FLAO|nr:type II 3-dehydroquinate dehydratase [Taishania pollutisoli]MBC9811104.1 type II 3-dehydroquinate dehydratase [Taishania pollutisoli]MBX2947981.1 type II 3-dehydroquinate dehydratase [Crocinitomicaceae bacterium]NGF76797.1 type II 3-dehydroquinate dehydratase [Fluviicola sp. SGL-29]
MKILIVNGPNLNLLGQRDVQMYGSRSFDDYFLELKNQFPGVELVSFQSNVEGELINILQQSTADGIILNAGGYTHTSVAIRDCIDAIAVPVVEVHLSNIAKRESFRHESMITPVCAGSIMGFGLRSYELAVKYFVS